MQTQFPKVELPQIPERIYRIEDYGAVKGGEVSNTEAIRKAIEAAHEAGGGRVVVGAGIWLTGPVELLSHVELHVEQGGLLLFHKHDEEYPLVRSNYEGESRIRATSPIHAMDQTDIAITGKGVIDGNGQLWRMVKSMKLTAKQWEKLTKSGGVVAEGNDGLHWFPSEGSYLGHKVPNVDPEDPDWQAKAMQYFDYHRPVMVNLIRCKRVLIEDITLQNSPAWNLHPIFCEHLTLRNAIIRNPWYAQNGDGLDLESCRFVEIDGTSFDVGDDAICMKAGKNAPARKIPIPTEYVTIRNCVVYHGHGGFVVGSEMSRGVRHILVSNCLFIGTDVGIRFKSALGRGGVVEDITLDGINMVNIENEAIIFTMGYTDAFDKNKAETDDVPEFKNIAIRNTVCRGAGRALRVDGLAQLPIHDITLENVELTAKTGFFCREAENIHFQNVTIVDERDPERRLHYDQATFAGGDASEF